MINKFEIIPDILEQDIQIVAEKFKTLDDLNLTNLVHVDIMDGIMVDNLTIALSELHEIEIDSKFEIDMHLMVEYPTEYLGECHSLKVKRVLAQIERMHSQTEFIETAKELNIIPVLALDLHTPVSAIETNLYDQIGGILLMSVKAGWSGQEFNSLVLDKIKELRSKEFNGNIIIDGGMTDRTICPCVEAGADQVAVNSFFWQAEDKGRVVRMAC